MTEQDLVEAERWADTLGGVTGKLIRGLVDEVRRLMDSGSVGDPEAAVTFPARFEGLTAGTDEVPDALPLRESLKTMRKASNKSQREVAEILAIHQTDVSDMEARSDYKVSTLRSFARALGGTCRVVFDFPNRPTVELVIPKADPR